MKTQKSERAALAGSPIDISEVLGKPADIATTTERSQRQRQPSIDMRTMPVPVGPFDYTIVAAGAAAELQDSAGRIRGLVKSTISNIILVGATLRRLKPTIEHGQFANWIESECGFSVRTAENYMAASTFAEGKNETVALLQPATVYRLAAKGAPREIVDDVIRRAENGDVVSDADVALALKQAKRQIKQQERHHRQKPPAPTKGQLAYRVKIQRKIEDDEKRRHDEALAAAGSILAELGTDNVRYVTDRLCRPGADTDRIVRELRKLIGGGTPH